MRRLYLGADHAGFRLKEAIKDFLASLDVSYKDLGNLKHELDDDYPDYSYKVARAVASHKGSLGILFCGSAQGACITANKVKGIRAAAVRSVGEARLAKEHDDVNVLCLAGGDQLRKRMRGIGLASTLAKEIVTAWLKAKFSSAKRHRRRVEKIKKLERRNFR